MILPYFVLLPLLAAFLIALLAGKKDDWAIALSFMATLSILALSVFGFITMREQTFTYAMSGWNIPIGICLVQDALSLFMLFMISLIALTSLCFSVQYIRHLAQDWKYYALFMLLLTGMNGVVVTGDLFNLYVFMEIALIAAFALVAYGCRAEEYEASFKYAIMGGFSSSVILIAIALTYSSTSTLTLAGIAQALPGLDQRLVMWIAALFLVGFGLKAAAIPFHTWLPDAHSSAPAPISSMLSGVLIKALGIYVLIRLFYNVFNAPPLFMNLLLIIGSVSIMLGVFLAIGQWDLKRLLAYHSISQIGYILLGLGLATPLGILGAVFHLFNHAIFKSLLFYGAGAVEMVLGTRNLKKMGKLAHLLPITAGTNMVASLSISGIPPFNGFFSKLILIIAAIQAGHPVYAFWAILGSLLTLASFMKVQRYGFYGEVEHQKPNIMPGKLIHAAMLILAVICLLSSLFIVPGIREHTLDPVVDVINNKIHYIELVYGRAL
ncbi:MAG TPA: proton-conducting transporter membrane subunit [bacterium]|nr:proton-conducting transporter membrane subunit [bacterium]HPG47272.1 proton-conducting transporter membrane subunit [bacterium]HPM99522.1 proton-conducting transporter membrane subunit [bacterium]